MKIAENRMRKAKGNWEDSRKYINRQYFQKKKKAKAFRNEQLK